MTSPRWKRRPHGSTWGDFGPDDERGRLNLITHFLGQVPYEPLTPKAVTFPERQEPGDYQEPDLGPLMIPTPF